MSCFRSDFQSTLLQHAGKVFILFCVMQTFEVQKTPRNSLEERFFSYGWSVTLTYSYVLYGLSAFSNRFAVLRKLSVAEKRKFGTAVNISLT